MTSSRTLVIIRGNSGAGKSSVARAVRDAYGRGCALIEQDHVRRVVLREHDTGGLAARLLTETVRIALDGGYHVVLEGILPSRHYGERLTRLMSEHAGPSFAYSLSVTLEESLRRHETRPETGFGPDQMTSWYDPDDLLRVPGESVIPESSSLAESVAHILHTSGLTSAAPASWCPVHCPRCRAAKLGAPDAGVGR